MKDYRGKMCLIDGEYLARCIIQDFHLRTLTFETEPDGILFEHEDDFGIEIYEEDKKEVTFEDVKHLLPRLNQT